MEPAITGRPPRADQHGYVAMKDEKPAVTASGLPEMDIGD
jgi:hypothetical protein